MNHSPESNIQPEQQPYILTDAQRQMLEDIGLGLRNPVQQILFTGEKEFLKTAANFEFYFASPESLAGSIYALQPVVQRFACIEHELYEELQGFGLKDKADKFMRAYTIMASLVDASDEAVLRVDTNGNSVPDDKFLCR